MPELDGPRWGPASKGVPRQLVVLCHGLGADGHDLIDLAPSWGHALPDALFVSVDAPFVHDSGFGRQWWSVADRSPSVVEAGVRRAAAFLGPFIDAELARLRLAAGRLCADGVQPGRDDGAVHRPAPRAAAARHPGLFRRADRPRHRWRPR